MKNLKKVFQTNNSTSCITVSGFTAEQLLSIDMLAYCGYKVEQSNLVPTGNYNPVPYEGISKADVQCRK